MATTPFMALTLPDPLVTLGPTWASMLNAALGVVDQHDHTDGRGLPITPAAVNINENLEFNTNAAVGLSYLNLVSLAASPVGTSQLHSVNGDLVWTNDDGTQVAITLGGTIAGSPGSIANLVAPAAAVYDSTPEYVRFFSTATTMAGLDVGFLSLREGRQAIEDTFSLLAPASATMPGSYSFTVPTALPPASPGYGLLAARNAAGVNANLEYQVFDDSSIESVLVGSVRTIRVKALGITNAMLAGNIAATKLVTGSVVGTYSGATATGQIQYRGLQTEALAELAVTTAKLADLSVTTAKLADGPNGVSTAKINVGAVTGGTAGISAAGSIAYQTITTENLADLQITTAKLANLSVSTGKIQDGAVTPFKRSRVFAEGYYDAPSALPINLSAAYLGMTRTALETADLTFNRPVTVTLQPYSGGGASIYDFSIENQNFGGGIKTAVVEVILRNAASIIRIFRTSVVIKGNFIESIRPLAFVHYPQNNFSGCFVDLFIRGDGTDLWLYAFANVWWTISQ